MPHDKNGLELKPGDRVTVECIVKDVQPGDYCTTTLETVEKMPGNGQTSTIIAINAKQVVKIALLMIAAFILTVSAFADEMQQTPAQALSSSAAVPCPHAALGDDCGRREAYAMLAREGEARAVLALTWVCPGPCGKDCRCADPAKCEAKACDGVRLPPLPGESIEEVRAALLADIDRLLEQRSWIVSDAQKRRLRAVRAVVESDNDVIAKIHAKLPSEAAPPAKLQQSGLAAAHAAVARGEMVTISIGSEGGDFHEDSIADFSPGLYLCWQTGDGKHKMQRGEWQSSQACNGAACAMQRVWVAR